MRICSRLPSGQLHIVLMADIKSYLLTCSTIIKCRYKACPVDGCRCKPCSCESCLERGAHANRAYTRSRETRERVIRLRLIAGLVTRLSFLERLALIMRVALAAAEPAE